MPQISRQSPPKKPGLKKPGIQPKYVDPVSRIVDLDNISLNGIKMLIYGHSGTGKTRFAGTFSVLGDMLYIVCSGNGMNEARSIRGLPNVKVVDIKNPRDLPALVQYAKKERFTTVVLDHMTDFGGLVLAEILGIEKIPEQLSWGLAKQEEYAQMGLQVKEYLRDLLNLKCNVLVLGQEREFKEGRDDNGDLILPYVSVATTPAIAGWIAPACDYVVRTFKKREKIVTRKMVGKKEIKSTKLGEVKYYLMTGPSEIYNTKFRVPYGTEIMDEVEDPSYEKISSLLEG